MSGKENNCGELGGEKKLDAPRWDQLGELCPFRTLHCLIRVDEGFGKGKEAWKCHEREGYGE